MGWNGMELNGMDQSLFLELIFIILQFMYGLEVD
jgi:hypothetical protein